MRRERNRREESGANLQNPKSCRLSVPGTSEKRAELDSSHLLSFHSSLEEPSRHCQRVQSISTNRCVRLSPHQRPSFPPLRRCCSYAAGLLSGRNWSNGRNEGERKEGRKGSSCAPTVVYVVYRTRPCSRTIPEAQEDTVLFTREVSSVEDRRAEERRSRQRTCTPGELSTASVITTLFSLGGHELHCAVFDAGGAIQDEGEEGSLRSAGGSGRAVMGVAG
jgi:hypothetical protein